MTFSIFLFGNTNNYPYLLGEALRDLGHDVTLAVNRAELLHRPESINPKLAENYPDSIVDAQWITESAVSKKERDVKEFINKHSSDADFAILNDYGLALADDLRCPHVALLTGSDLTYYANPALPEIKSQDWAFNFKQSSEGVRQLTAFEELLKSQRRGIQNAALVSFATKGLVPKGDKILQDLGVSDARRCFLYFGRGRPLVSKQQTSDRRKRLILLNGARILWTPKSLSGCSTQDLKGTNVLLEGFARFISTGGQAELRLVRKGQDIPEAERLIESLRITDQVVWLPELSSTAFSREIERCDIVCDQFGLSFPGMVTIQAFFAGKPVIANFRRGIAHLNLPGLNAETPEEVCAQLHFAQANSAKLRELGNESSRFAAQYLTARDAANQLMAIMIPVLSGSKRRP